MGYRPYHFFFRDLLLRGQWFKAWREAKRIHQETGLNPRKQLLAGVGLAIMPARLTRTVVKRLYLRALKKKAKDLFENNAAIGRLLQVVGDASRPESYPWRRTVESLADHLRGLVRDFGLPILLRYEDRNSMAHSIEARVPFTDYRIVELAFSGKLDPHKISEGWSKWVLRRACADLSPEDIIWRKDKMGFGTPEQEYTEGLAKAWKTAGRQFTKLRGLIKLSRVEGILGRLCNGEALPLAELNLAFRHMVAEEWLRRFDLEIG
jgi:asparagine synthetase B (glutamine-hydrolysing)